MQYIRLNWESQLEKVRIGDSWLPVLVLVPYDMHLYAPSRSCIEFDAINRDRTHAAADL